MIFSNKGKPIPNTEDTLYMENGIVKRSGNDLYGPGGAMTADRGDILFSSKGAMPVSGNTIYSAGGTYRLAGNTLYGPNGKIWHGVSSMEEAKTIAAADPE